MRLVQLIITTHLPSIKLWCLSRRLQYPYMNEHTKSHLLKFQKSCLCTVSNVKISGRNFFSRFFFPDSNQVAKIKTAYMHARWPMFKWSQIFTDGKARRKKLNDSASQVIHLQLRKNILNQPCGYAYWAPGISQ